MKNYIDFTKKLNINDVGFDGRTSVADIMQLFQQAVTVHTFELGLDFETIGKKHNAKWFIISAHIEIDKRPRIDDTVTVRTWPLRASALKFPRAFVMKDEKGDRLACAMTNWCIVDRDTNALMRSNVLEFPFDEFLQDDPTVRGGRFPVCPKGELCYERKMLLSDLDLNRHVNNVSYIRIAMDCFTMSEIENMDIKAFDIQYKLQCFEGDTLSLYKQKTETGYIIDGLRGDETVFRVKIEL